MKKIILLVAFVFAGFLFKASAQFALPYINSFDTGSAVGWTHYSLSGTDNWQLGVPTQGAHSSPNCWKTNLSGNHAASSQMCLESPSFDFSTQMQPQVLNFWHWRNQASGTTTRVQYSIDGGMNWTTLFSNNPQLINAWYPSASGWLGNSGSWWPTSFSLGFLNGQGDVRLRFVLTSSTSVAAGWMIDNIYIGPEYFNLYATHGDTIDRFSAFMPTFTVTTDLFYDNQYEATFADSIYYYFSYDAILDPGDSIIGRVLRNHSGNVNNYANVFTTPSPLYAGTYYIFFSIDFPDALAENNETDNTEFAVLIVDSTIALPYSNDFEDSTAMQWNVLVTSSSCGVPDYWTVETPYRHHLDGAHSGEKAWSSSDAAVYWQNNTCGGYVETPFIDLTTAVNPVVALWYINYSGATSAPSYIRYSLNGATPASQLVLLGYSDNDEWDYQVVSLASISSSEHAKLGFFTTAAIIGGNNAEGMAFDDIYIGPALADVSLEGDKADRFTSSSSATDTLRYWFVNSGIGNTAGTKTYFYWSTDSISDGSDILLGSKTEPTVPDTSGVWTYFSFTKPTLATGRYYIFYVADSLHAIPEMREYNNRGYFILHQQNLLPLPYTNDFEVQIDEWRHASSLGPDDWNWGSPTGPVLTPAFSGTKAWITNANGDSLSDLNRIHIYTPVFDFTTMSNPVLEFDMINRPFGILNNLAGGNITYSVDGGATWILVDTTSSQSFKEMYYPETYETWGGIDKFNVNPWTIRVLFGAQELSFGPDEFNYQTRDARNISHYVVDLSFLAGYKNVQLRFNYGSLNSHAPGVMIDNFSITNAETDLVVDQQKNLMWSEQANSIRFYCDVYNAGNYRAPNSAVKFYLSADSLYDLSDQFIGAQNAGAIRPGYSQQIVADNPVSSWAGYQWLLILSDANNNIAESDETNNITAWPLGINDTMIYPYFNDFSDSAIDGWTYYNSGAIYSSYRFRHKPVVGDWVFQPPADMWFLDRVDPNITSYNWLPTFYLESPTFNFTGFGRITMDFDMMCVGSSSPTSGGNLQYSVDGGSTWAVITSTLVTNDTNWYNATTISTLNNAQGWRGLPGDPMVHVYADVSFLAGESDVKFRFAYKSKAISVQPGVQGLRVDNFRVNALTIDYVATVPQATLINTVIAQPTFPITYEIQNVGAAAGHPSSTKLYWSSDTILDTGDALLYNYPEVSIPSGGNVSSPQTIQYPQPVAQLTYYLFYFTDDDSTNVEISETNNTSYFTIVFDSLNIGLPEFNSGNTASVAAENNTLYLLTNFAHSSPASRLQLYDTKGALVYDETVSINAGQQKSALSIQLSTGVYSMKLEDKEGKIYGGTFVWMER